MHLMSHIILLCSDTIAQLTSIIYPYSDLQIGEALVYVLVVYRSAESVRWQNEVSAIDASCGVDYQFL